MKFNLLNSNIRVTVLKLNNEEKLIESKTKALIFESKKQEIKEKITKINNKLSQNNKYIIRIYDINEKKYFLVKRIHNDNLTTKEILQKLTGETKYKKYSLSIINNETRERDQVTFKFTSKKDYDELLQELKIHVKKIEKKYHEKDNIIFVNNNSKKHTHLILLNYKKIRRGLTVKMNNLKSEIVKEMILNDWI